MEEEDGEPREQRFEFQRFFEKGGETTGKDGREEGRKGGSEGGGRNESPARKNGRGLERSGESRGANRRPLERGRPHTAAPHAPLSLLLCLSLPLSLSLRSFRNIGIDIYARGRDPRSEVATLHLCARI